MDLHEILLTSKIVRKNGGDSADLTDYYTKSQTDSRISEKVAEIVANAPDDFDTLKELSDWIANHEDSAAAMNSAIATNTTAIDTKADKTTTYTKTETDNLLDNKVDSESGKGLSTNDFTNADKSKLDELENYNDTEVKADIAESASQAAINKSTLGYQNKNLLLNNCQTFTRNGVTATINGNKSITFTGSNTGNSDFVFYWNMQTGSATSNFGENNKKWLLNGEYIVSGGHGGATVQICKSKDNNSTTLLAQSSNGNKVAFNITDEDNYVWARILIVVNADFTTPVTIYPMIRYADITDDTYEPYKPSVEERLNDITNQIFGLGTNIPSGANLNDYTTPGVYCSTNSTVSATLTNCPISETGFRLEVKYTVGVGRFMQTLYPNAMVSGYYVRNYGTSGFGYWYKFSGEAVTT